MPHSWHYPTGVMLDHVWRLQPRSVLDIGAGMGKWGFLIREMLDWNAGRLDRDSWSTRIDGLDAHLANTPLFAWVYNDVREVNILDCSSDVEGYDLVLMSDVIEHIGKPAARTLVDHVVAHNRNLLISTPLTFFEQEIGNNPFEQHVSHWTTDDFKRYRSDIDIAGGAALVVNIAGRGATYPSRAQANLSAVLDRVPVVNSHGAIRRVAKQGGLRLLEAFSKRS